jgi:cation diffusion facilitator CzcD-associated flavoprotein CzcO
MVDSSALQPSAADGDRADVSQPDAIVIGAGLSGLYQTYRLREAGFTVQCFEEGAGVGGVWHWNRYPGCAFDSPSEEYGYSFSAEVLQEWEWSDYFSYQPDTERYLNYVTDRLDLRRLIRFNARVTAATWHEAERLWEVELENGEQALTSFLIFATGSLSAPRTPRFDGMDLFEGQQQHTGRWPKDGVDFAGKRVAVIGTGPSAIQLIPEVARRCGHLTVFQRTPNYAVASGNAPIDPEVQQGWKENYAEIHQTMRTSYWGIQCVQDPRSAHDVSKEVRLRLYEEAWQRRGYAKFMSLFRDLVLDPEINAEYCEFLHGKIGGRVNDPAVRQKLLPDHPFFARPVMLENGYYETFNRDNVLLVDARETPIDSLTEKGIRTTDREYEFDIVVYATGFDVHTGSLKRIDIRGVDGQTLGAKLDEHGPAFHLGVSATGFPNLLLCRSPAVCGTYTVCAEWVVDWIAECLLHMQANGYTRIEPTREAEAAAIEQLEVTKSLRLFELKPGPPWHDDLLAAGYDGFEFQVAGGST